ncbi:MAG: DUF4351 domain-containing protein [Caldilinea sp.]
MTAAISGDELSNKAEIFEALWYTRYQQEHALRSLEALLHFVDWLLWLPGNLEQQFKQQLEQLEAQTQMRYVTSIERIAREEGRKEGREEGREKCREEGREKGREEGREEGRKEGATYMLLRLLEHRFGELPEAVTAHVQRLSLAQTEVLVNQALGAESLAQFVTHLPE